MVFLKMIDMVGSVVVVVVMVTMESVRASLAPLQGSHLEQFQLANLLLSIKLDQGALGMSDPCGSLQPNSVCRINCLLSNFYFCAH